MKDKSLQKIYKSKLRTADDALRMIRSGQRVFIGSSCGEPQHLVNALMDNAQFFSDVEKDVQTRFFSIRRSFYREDMETMFQVD